MQSGKPVSQSGHRLGTDVISLLRLQSVDAVGKKIHPRFQKQVQVVVQMVVHVQSAVYASSYETFL